MRYPFVALALALLIGSAILVPPAPASAQAAPRQERSLDWFINQEVVPTLDAFWKETARQNNLPYRSPKVRLFRSGERVVSACDNGVITGHAYCGLDQTLYLDVGTRNSSSFGTLWSQDRDFAIVLIVAHEWGHHIQRQTVATAATMSTKQSELQADCLAGVFARYSANERYMEPGDMEEGMDISLESGDPTHGTGQERSDWFMKGYDGYSGAACGIRR